ncbi:MAG: YqhV family protein [Limnochordia bacterium]
METKLVSGMALLRILAGGIEIGAALLMLHYRRVDTALRINGVLGIIGPTILMLVSTLGLVGLAGQVDWDRYLIVLFGVLLIFLGVR